MGDAPALTDHLGSAQVGGAASGVQRYSAFGEVRSRGGEMPTAYQYTGQLSQMEQVGLYHYGARWFDPVIPQFTQPDQIIPDPYNSLYWNRFAYVRYNAINFNDPSGHKACSSDGDSFDSCTDPLAEPTNWEEIEKTWVILNDVTCVFSEQSKPSLNTRNKFITETKLYIRVRKIFLTILFDSFTNFIGVHHVKSP